MMLEPAGREKVARALSGYVGLLAGDAEAEGFERQQTDLTERGTVRFGPARRSMQITGISIFQMGTRVLTQPLPTPLRLAAGQTLELTVEME